MALHVISNSTARGVTSPGLQDHVLHRNDLSRRTQEKTRQDRTLLCEILTNRLSTWVANLAPPLAHYRALRTLVDTAYLLFILRATSAPL